MQMWESGMSLELDMLITGMRKYRCDIARFVMMREGDGARE